MFTGDSAHFGLLQVNDLGDEEGVLAFREPYVFSNGGSMMDNILTCRGDTSDIYGFRGLECEMLCNT